MNKSYETKLLDNWEEIFRQGLLTFWVLVALKDQELSISDIRAQVDSLTRGSYQTSDQVLYRLLRKHYDLEIVNVREVKGNSGPNKKLYSLSSIGEKLLIDFSKRNISLFMQPKVQNILKEGILEK